MGQCHDQSPPKNGAEAERGHVGLLVRNGHSAHQPKKYRATRNVSCPMSISPTVARKLKHSTQVEEGLNATKGCCPNPPPELWETLFTGWCPQEVHSVYCTWLQGFSCLSGRWSRCCKQVVLSRNDTKGLANRNQLHRRKRKNNPGIVILSPTFLGNLTLMCGRDVDECQRRLIRAADSERAFFRHKTTCATGTDWGSVVRSKEIGVCNFIIVSMQIQSATSSEI